MDEKIRVMIIDDSALMRNLLSTTLSNYETITVVGTAINGRFGLKKLNILKPDIIILDLEMPDMNGIEFLKEKQKLEIKTPVIILSAHAKKGAKITLDALSLGASDFILKPSGSADEIRSTKDELVEMILALSTPNSYIATDAKSKIQPLEFERIVVAEPKKIETKNYLQPAQPIPQIDILAIGISTGGPNALRNMLVKFPEDFPVPIVIVQHMPPGFTFEFAKSLNAICKLEVKEAEENDIVKPGRIFIAPGDKHVRFSKKKLATVITLDDTPAISGHKPSVDVLFESVAEVYGKNAIACIMTGMGKDGAANIGLILKKGGVTIAQDQSSCIVFGMPKIAIMNNNIQYICNLDDIPATIFDILEKSRRENN